MTSLSGNNRYEKNIFLNFIIAIGRNSYEIYLFHLVVLGLMKVVYIPQTTSGNIKVLLLVIYIILTLILGSLIAKYFSNPINSKIRNKWINNK